MSPRTCIDYCEFYQKHSIRSADPIAVLNMPARLYGLLKRLDVHTVGDLLARNLDELSTAKGLGTGTRNRTELERILKALRLADSPRGRLAQP